MTDNGGTAGVQFYNAGMRGRKTQIYDGGHRVPCFVRWPDGGLRAPARRRIRRPRCRTSCRRCRSVRTEEARRREVRRASASPACCGAGSVQPDRMMVVQYGQILKKWDSRHLGPVAPGQRRRALRLPAPTRPNRTTWPPTAGHVSKMRAHYETMVGRHRTHPARLLSHQRRRAAGEPRRSLLFGLAGDLLRQHQRRAHRPRRPARRPVEYSGGARPATTKSIGALALLPRSRLERSVPGEEDDGGYAAGRQSAAH